jgi:hypothetical protein
MSRRGPGLETRGAPQTDPATDDHRHLTDHHVVRRRTSRNADGELVDLDLVDEFGQLVERFGFAKAWDIFCADLPGHTADHTSVPAVTALCAVCGRDTAWMRTDARYCSNACRQRAYRLRKAGS